MKIWVQGSKVARLVVSLVMCISAEIVAEGIIQPSNGRRFVASPASMNLTGSLNLNNLKTRAKSVFLRDREDLDFKNKLWTFMIESEPNLAYFSERVDIKLKSKWSRLQTDHYRYQLYIDNIPVHAATITAHFSKYKVRAISLSLPSFSKIEGYPHQVVDFKSAEEADGKFATYVAIGKELRVVLHYTRKDDAGVVKDYWEDALTGKVIEESIAGFDLIEGRVQTTNDRNSETEMVELVGLAKGDQLVGSYFAIDTEHDIGQVVAENNEFDFQPYDRARFDQVAAYHNLSEGLNWFVDKFNYTYEENEPMPVILDSELDGSPNNARYVPKGELGDMPMLIFGKGSSGKFENLGRDRDVAMHELSHHIIYKFIDDARGQAGALHEGFADYFTYSKSGDPFLAEQVVPDAPYIRTAKIDNDRKYDNPYVQRNTHSLGQIWSAFLWETREKLGESFDTTVYQSLHYLNAGSTFGDAIEALMLADVDANPSFAASPDDADAAVTGPNKCEILGAAVNRGYISYLTHLDGKSCGLDMDSIAAQSAAKNESKYDDGPLLFKACGQIKESNNPISLIILAISLLTPLLLPLIFRNEVRR